MKTVFVALLVFFAVSHSKALQCNCGGSKYCSRPIETCLGATDVCASIIIFAGTRPTYSKGCMRMEDCMKLNFPGLTSARCCRTNLCNV